MGKVPIYRYSSLEFHDVSLTIKTNPSFVRVDRHVQGRFGYLSRNYIQGLIHKGSVRVNGMEVRPSRKLRVGDRIDLRLPVIPERIIEPEQMDLSIIYEDHDILVINKPADLTCHAGKRYHGGTLANAIIYHLYGTEKDAGKKSPGIVHRLDKNTSGVMVIAKNLLSHQTLSKQFARGSIVKQYLALIKGVPRRRRGIIESPIGYHPRLRNVMSVRLDATQRKRSVTHYILDEKFRDGALLSLAPKTGRTHQLRVHLESIGHPIFGEDRYSGQYSFSFFDRVISRQALHAWQISFAHPITGKEITFKAELPQDMLRLMSLLRKNSPDAARPLEKFHHH